MKFSLNDILFLRRLRGKAESNTSDSSSPSSSSNVMIVKPTEYYRNANEEQVGSSGDTYQIRVECSVIYDKTWQEVHDALEAGTQVYIDIGHQTDILLEGYYIQESLSQSSKEVENLYTKARNEVDSEVASLLPVAAAHKRRFDLRDYYGNEHPVERYELFTPMMFDSFSTFSLSFGAVNRDDYIDSLFETTYPKPSDYAPDDDGGEVVS